MTLQQAAEAASPAFLRQDGAPGGFEPSAGTDRTPTLADATRRCGSLARDIGASAFGLYAVAPPSDRAMLSPLIDSGCGDHNLASPGGRGHPVVLHARNSTAPCWWSGGPTLSTHAFGRLDWAAKTSPLMPGTTGIAFPVHSDRGDCGVFVFLGDAMAISPAALLDFHARCFALFEDVSRIRRGDGETLPSISRRELECLKLTANGHTSEEIARLLNLSVHTANQYLTNTTRKLDAVNRMHAVAKALRMGLIE